jgi:uncharacterized protein YndB with AHSA1/START domain
METDPAERRLELVRTFDAPRNLVFAAWTEPERMKLWWGPKGWTIPFSEADLRPGGAFRYAMRSPDGEEHLVEGVISEIEPPSRFVTMSELGGDGNHPPVQVVTAVTFEAQGESTRVRIETIVTGSAEIIDAATEGMDAHWGEHLDRLRDHLKTEEKP